MCVIVCNVAASKYQHCGSIICCCDYTILLLLYVTASDKVLSTLLAITNHEHPTDSATR